MSYKQVIVVRNDLKMSKGKIAVQVAHAAILGYLMAKDEIRKKWINEGQKKIILKVKDLKELIKVKEEAERINLKAELVQNAGLTELPPSTITALVIGPDVEEKIDKVTKKLPLL
ncbi:peptidyl-tRNA hydrolase [Candidatus Bathyarchaeota archaeon]|nr:MAG: peptidyl-tRNA hydrolase [Candidatus Bathyarchaeota archaeon]